LNGVKLAYPAGHEKALDKTKKCSEARPEEAAVKNSQARSAQIKVMSAKGAQKERQQNAHHLITAHGIILLIKDRLWAGIRLAAHGHFSLHCLHNTQFNSCGFQTLVDYGLLRSPILATPNDSVASNSA
jgi:hypothetical protein